MSINIQAAIYVRVSSEQQAAADSNASQLTALRERIAKDRLSSHCELEFIDEG
jgi:DNA invertase Pin-like site-specific DNA recombinase